MSTKSLNIAALSQEDREALMAQLQEVNKDRHTQLVHTYATHLSAFVTSVIENGTLAKSQKSDWVGYRESGIPVTVEGHTFTVSVTVTDGQAKEDRAKERALAEARAIIAAAEAAAEADDDSSPEE